MVNRIYTPQSLHLGQQLMLEAQAARHVAQVLRMTVGAELVVFNGDGRDYAATLTTVSKKSVVVQIQSVTTGVSSPINVHLGQVVSRGERMDYAIQKAVELGVREITPLTSKRCGVKLNAERATKRQAHWQAVAISALEQSGRADFVTVHPVMTWQEWAATVAADHKWLLHFATTRAPAQVLKPGQRIALAIGPEGGWAEEELSDLSIHGFHTGAWVRVCYVRKRRRWLHWLFCSTSWVILLICEKSLTRLWDIAVNY
jgi:16S rRNA (uracil1498-N3)-methyltransferase